MTRTILLWLMMRLNRFLALCGLGSRRKCESLIQAGRVTVDGIIVTVLGTAVDEKKHIITVDGKRVVRPEQFSYILMNKPRGYVTTACDELGRRTVMDLLPNAIRVFPVGRLDKETMGALLLTNDGQLAFRLMHPKFKVTKIYHVTLDKAITPTLITKLATGVSLENEITRPCEVKVIRKDRKQVEIMLHEGRKRQIRRMMQSLGYKTIHLVRLKFATLTLEGLKPGEWRYLSLPEIARLKATVKSI